MVICSVGRVGRCGFQRWGHSLGCSGCFESLLYTQYAVVQTLGFKLLCAFAMVCKYNWCVCNSLQSATGLNMFCHVLLIRIN